MNSKQGREHTITNSTRTAQLITFARISQGLTLREFGKALNVSQTQAQNYERGQEPDRARVAAWIESDTPWVHSLGLEIFGSQFGALIQAALVPGETRYAMTPKSEELA